MPAINITDLNNAKLDVDHIAAIATSLDPTATDRLGHEKQTMQGATVAIASKVAAVDAAASTAITVIPAKVAEVSEAVAATYVGQAGAAKDAAVAAKAGAELALSAAQTNAGIKDTTAAGIADTTATTNKYFWTPLVGSNDLLILWKNVAGVAVEQGRYSNASVVTALNQSLTAQQRRESQQQVAWMLVNNDNSLNAQAALYPKTLPASLVSSGDSTMFGLADYLSTWMTGSILNIAQGGTSSHTILAAYSALSAGQKDSYGMVNGGTNDYRSQVSGVVAATITSAGTGGTDGTYTVPTTGGSGVAPIQASFSVVVSGGSIISATSLAIGGGFLVGTMPAFNLAGIPGLTGAVLTPVFNIPESLKSNLTNYMLMAGAKKVMAAPWEGATSAFDGWARLRRIAQWERTAYGVRAFDPIPFLALHNSGTELLDLDPARGGAISRVLSSDGTHLSGAGLRILEREYARIIRAQAEIGAPYIHLDLVGAKQSAAVGSTITTIRALGARNSYKIITGNPSDAFRLGYVGATATQTGDITRGAGLLPAVSEIYLQADSESKGLGNISRTVVLRQMEGTSPQSIVRFNGGKAQTLAIDSLLGSVATKKVTVVICARFSAEVVNQVFISYYRPIFGKSSLIERAIGKLAFLFSGCCQGYSGTPIPGEFNFYFFSFDTSVAGSSQTYTNETGGPVMAKTLDGLFAMNNQMAFFGEQLTGFDLKMFWMAPDFIDLENPTNRKLFYDPVSRLPKDIGNAGTVAGITPLVYLRGEAGDYGLGKNYGSGGDLFAPPYINLQNYPFIDIAS